MAVEKKEALEVLQALLAENEQKLGDAVRVVNETRPVVFSLRNTISALKGQKMAGQGVQFLYNTDFSEWLVNRGASGLPIQPLPSRKPEFANMTIMASLQAVLAKRPGEFVHADELVKAIYEPTEDNDIFYRIKRTLVSEILRGIKKGLFVRGPGKNTFGAGLMTNGKQKEGRPTL